jgi:hypothetical protein
MKMQKENSKPMHLPSSNAGHPEELLRNRDTGHPMMPCSKKLAPLKKVLNPSKSGR